MTPRFQLVTTNVGGNLHAASRYINRCGLAEFVLNIDYSGSGTVIVLRVPYKKAPIIRAFFGDMPECCPNEPIFKDAPKM